jgi:dienelactone hydrolase
MTQPGIPSAFRPIEREVRIQANGATLLGDLVIPAGATAIVLFAHGSGSSRHSSRNRSVARVLQEAGLGTLLMDLLTPAEEEVDNVTRHLRFDIPLLADRLTGAVDWLSRLPETRDLLIGLFGASTGAAAALVAAAASPDAVRAVVSRGGRPDLAGSALELVSAPTLLIVGGDDDGVIDLNEQALARLRASKDMVLVPGATHLFEEPGALEQVARLAQQWFTRYLRRPHNTYERLAGRR